MTSAEIIAELRASAPAAPDHLRDRVRTTVAMEGVKRNRGFTPRRVSLVFAGGLVAAALGAALVHGIATGNGTGSKKAVWAAQTTSVGQGAALKQLRAPANKPVLKATAGADAAQSHVYGLQRNVGAAALAPSLPQSSAAGTTTATQQFRAAIEAPATLPPADLRLQNYEVSLGVGVKDPAALSKATVRAMKLTRGYGGYVARVSYATPSVKHGESILLLRIPVAKVQDALQQFSALGTLTSQHVSIQDLQGTVNAQTKRIIQLNRRIGAIEKALESTTLTVDEQARLQGELTARKQELAAVAGAKRTTTTEGRLAHVYLTLHTQQAKAKKKHHVVPVKPGRIERKLDAAGSVLAQELAVLLYVLVILAPFLLLGAAAAFTARALRRRSDRRLLAS
jgi:hypothetical protein